MGQFGALCNENITFEEFGEICEGYAIVNNIPMKSLFIMYLLYLLYLLLFIMYFLANVQDVVGDISSF